MDSHVLAVSMLVDPEVGQQHIDLTASDPKLGDSWFRGVYLWESPVPRCVPMGDLQFRGGCTSGCLILFHLLLCLQVIK